MQNKLSLLFGTRLKFVLSKHNPSIMELWINLQITYQVRIAPAVKGECHFMPLTIHLEVATGSFHFHLIGTNIRPSLEYLKYAPRICDFVKKPQTVFKSWIKNKSNIYEYRNNHSFIIFSHYIASLPETWHSMLQFNNNLLNRS